MANPSRPTLHFVLTEIPSFAGDAAATLDPTQNVLLGSAYRFDTPVTSAQPYVVRLTYSDIPAGFDPANLAVALRSEIHFDGQTDPGETTFFYTLPATIDSATHTATFEVHASAAFQLAATKQAPSIVGAAPSGVVRTWSPRSTEEGGPDVDVIFERLPADANLVVLQTDSALTSFTAAWQWARVHGFIPPPGKMHIVFDDLPGFSERVMGGVDLRDPWVIHLRSTLTDASAIQKYLAHEFFHTIQGFATNNASADVLANAWFLDGTASWASDEVPILDGIADRYFATTWERLTRPLDKRPQGANDEDPYRTVGFWKWVEAQSQNGQTGAGTISRMLANEMAATHDSSFLPLGIYIQNSYQDKTDLQYFLDVYPDVDLLQYAIDILHRKNFDTNETAPGDLWSDYPQMGRPGSFDGLDLEWLDMGQPGASPEDPLTVEYQLTEHLTIAAKVLLTSMPGHLHLQFQETALDQEYDAAVIVFTSSDDGPPSVSQLLAFRNLSRQLDEIDVPFGLGGLGWRAMVIVVDRRWRHEATPAERTGQYRVWMCGPDDCGGGVCTDTQTDPQNCGTCGNVCANGMNCVGGSCEGSIVCPDPYQVPCGSVCTDLRNDPNHCGWCHQACGPGATCTSGWCTCPAGLTWCGGDVGCVEVGTDPRNCGGCGANCGTATCKDGLCVCPEGQSFCGGPVAGCFDLMSDPSNCGRCGLSCTGSVGCVGGRCQCADPKLTWCDGTCVDTQTDELNCGRCGNQCLGRCPGTPSACEWGTCWIHAEYWCGECGQGCTRDQWCQPLPEWHCEPCYSWQHRCAMDNACCSYNCCPAPDTGAEHCYQAVCP